MHGQNHIKFRKNNLRWQRSDIYT